MDANGDAMRLRWHVEPLQRGLVADDTRVSRMIVDRAMFKHGLVAVQVEDGLDAWNYLQREQVDVVVTDVEMPRWSGIDLLKRMRLSRNRRLAEMPVIVVSSLRDRKLIRFVRKCNFAYFMSKPVSIRQRDVMLGLIETSRWLRSRRETA